MSEAVEAGETGVRAEQLSVCTLQAGSVCSVDTGGVRRVSALSSVPLHGYACVCVCVYGGGSTKEVERGQVGGAKRLTDQCGQVEDSHYRGTRCTVPASLSVSLTFMSVCLFI